MGQQRAMAPVKEPAPPWEPKEGDEVGKRSGKFFHSKSKKATIKAFTTNEYDGKPAVQTECGEVISLRALCPYVEKEVSMLSLQPMYSDEKDEADYANEF